MSLLTFSLDMTRLIQLTETWMLYLITDGYQNVYMLLQLIRDTRKAYLVDYVLTYMDPGYTNKSLTSVDNI